MASGVSVATLDDTIFHAGTMAMPMLKLSRTDGKILRQIVQNLRTKMSGRARPAARLLRSFDGVADILSIS